MHQNRLSVHTREPTTSQQPHKSRYAWWKENTLESMKNFDFFTSDPAATAPNNNTCRFFPECKKTDCPFFHPKVSLSSIYCSWLNILIVFIIFNKTAYYSLLMSYPDLKNNFSELYKCLIFWIHVWIMTTEVNKRTYLFIPLLFGVAV